MANPSYVDKTSQKNDTATATPSVGVPAGTLVGMILTLVLNADTDASNVVTPPAGFALKQEAHTAAPADVQSLYMWQKVAGASETGPYTCTFAGGACRNTLVCASVKDADSAALLSSINSTNTNTGNPTTATATAITTVTPNNVIINFTASDDTGGVSGITPPTGYVEQFDSVGGVGNAMNFSTITQAVAGSTGAVTSQIVGATQCAWLVAMAAFAPVATPAGGVAVNNDRLGVKLGIGI